MPQDSADASDAMPADVQRSWDDNELDVVADWFLALPEETRLRGRAAEIGRDLAEAFVPIDPALALRLLDRMLVGREGALRLLELSVDAAARAGDGATAIARAAAAREAARHVARAERAAVLSNIGAFLIQLGSYDEAESALDDAIDAAGEDPTRLVPALVNLATLHFDRAHYRGEATQSGPQAGLEALERAERAAESVGDAARLGTIWFNRGYFYATGGASAQASHAYARAEEFFVAAGSDPLDLAFLHRARAADAGRNGRLANAITEYTKARDLFAAAGSLDEAATAAVGLIMAMQLSGRTPTAKEQDEVLIALRRSRPDRVPELLMNLGNIAVDQDFDVAEQYFLDAETGFRAQGREVDTQRARHAQAVIWRRRARPERALEILEAVRDRYREWGLDVKVAEATFNIGLVHRDRQDPGTLDDALAAFETLDRYRHELGTAGDRAGVLRVTYPHLYDLVVDAALLADEPDVIAAVAECARTQTTLGQARIPDVE